MFYGDLPGKNRKDFHSLISPYTIHIKSKKKKYTRKFLRYYKRKMNKKMKKMKRKDADSYEQKKIKKSQHEMKIC